MFCKNCGTPMKDGAKFCPKCGARQEAADQGRMEQASTAAPSPKKPDKPKKKFPIWLLIIPICLVIGILAAFMAPKVLDAISGKGGTETEIAKDEDKNWDSGKKEDDQQEKKEETEASETETSAEETTPAQTVEETTAAQTTAAAPETTSAWLLDGSPDLTGYARVGIIQSGSTSTIEQENNQNGPEMAVDGDEVTSWQEGVEGPGIGETIYYKLDQEQPITYLTFKLGNWRNDKYFYGNNRPRTLTITLDDYSFQITFPAEQREYVVQVDPPYPASYIEYRIDDVYKGSSYDDTCIAELGMYCKVGE